MNFHKLSTYITRSQTETTLPDPKHSHLLPTPRIAAFLTSSTMHLVLLVSELCRLFLLIAIPYTLPLWEYAIIYLPILLVVGIQVVSS